MSPSKADIPKPIEKQQFDDVLKRMFSMPPAPKKAAPKRAQQPKK